VDSEIVSVTSAVGAMYVVPRVENLGSVHTAGVIVAIGEAEMEGVLVGGDVAVAVPVDVDVETLDDVDTAVREPVAELVDVDTDEDVDVATDERVRVPVDVRLRVEEKLRVDDGDCWHAHA
jgi:hypothetical protein